MTTNRSPLTDALLRQGLGELAAGPDGSELLADVLRTVDATPQARGLLWQRDAAPRPAVMMLAAALLLVALLGAVAILSGVLPPPIPAPFVPQNVVVQQWNELRGDEFQITHAAIGPTGEPADVALDALPANAGFVRWSPDGLRLVYLEVEAPPESRGYSHLGIFLAGADGSDPVRVSTPRALDMYDFSGWFNGAYWAPSSRLFALGWNTHGCDTGPDCLPDAGIDIFDTNGQLVAAIQTPDAPALLPAWSPDSERIGWLTGSCPDGRCVTDTFHWQFVEGDETIHSLSLGPDSTVVWSRSDRLLVSTLDHRQVSDGDTISFTTTTERVYSINPDGADEQEVTWEEGATGIPVWSPDGRWLAISDFEAQRLTIRDAESGEDVVVALSTGMELAMWSPDSDRVVLYGSAGASNNFALYTVNVDGKGLVPVGEAWDFAWMPIPGDDEDESDAPATPAPASPAPSEGPGSATRSVEDFVRPFTYVMPVTMPGVLAARGVAVTPTQLHSYWSIGRGIDVFAVTGVIDPCPSQFPDPTPGPNGEPPLSSITISTSPVGYLEELRDVARVGIGPISATQVDGHAGAMAAIDPPEGGCTRTRIHIDGVGGFEFAVTEPALDVPGVLIVVSVDGEPVGIRIWGQDADTLEEWMPVAMELVESIDFISQP